MTLDAQIMPPMLSMKSLYDRQRELATDTRPSAFKLTAQMLDQGRTDIPLAATEDLTLRVKVYASGGENTLHAHPSEDHSFIVLQGSARFEGADGELAHLGVHEGIMLPRGTLYSFLATSDQPLVLLRIGTPNGDKQGSGNRLGKAGGYMAGDSAENKTVPVIFRDGDFFE
jgi:mannose-6-phosphate isomerase-like protein (cupin superfamily)